MTDEAKALVERLRDDLPQTLLEKHWVDDHDAIYKQREEAADLIETQAREIERLRGLVQGWHYLAVGPDEMGDYYTQKALIKASEPYASPALKALAGDSHD